MEKDNFEKYNNEFNGSDFEKRFFDEEDKIYRDKNGKKHAFNEPSQSLSNEEKPTTKDEKRRFDKRGGETGFSEENTAEITHESKNDGQINLEEFKRLIEQRQQRLRMFPKTNRQSKEQLYVYQENGEVPKSETKPEKGDEIKMENRIINDQEYLSALSWVKTDIDNLTEYFEMGVMPSKTSIIEGINQVKLSLKKLLNVAKIDDEITLKKEEKMEIRQDSHVRTNAQSDLEDKINFLIDQNYDIKKQLEKQVSHEISDDTQERRILSLQEEIKKLRDFIFLKSKENSIISQSQRKSGLSEEELSKAIELNSEQIFHEISSLKDSLVQNFKVQETKINEGLDYLADSFESHQSFGNNSNQESKNEEMLAMIVRINHNSKLQLALLSRMSKEILKMYKQQNEYLNGIEKSAQLPSNEEVESISDFEMKISQLQSELDDIYLLVKDDQNLKNDLEKVELSDEKESSRAYLKEIENLKNLANEMSKLD